MDIFEVNKEGGIPKRLTTHSGNETPVAYKDAGHILFLANIMPTAEDAQFPSGQFQQVYEVNTEGGRPILFSFHADGRYQYQSYRQYFTLP